MNGVELALRVVNGIQVSEWDRYDLPLRLAEASQLSTWKINVIPCCWDGVPLLHVRGRKKEE